jgi:F420-dependent oxidoreductase-like protein
MLEVSVMIEGQDGLNWPRWNRLVEAVERLGFAGLYRSDHFTNANPPDKDSLECWVSLTYLADHTDRIRFGPLVSPVSFRHPSFLARQAAALDDLSGGRMVLGVGAGWQEREHALFGHDLGDVPTRMDRLEEALEVVSRLLRSDEPVTYSGRFYRLDGATMLPRPSRPGGPPILVGGGGPRRTLPLAARHAEVWNVFGHTPEAFTEKSRRLDDLLTEQGRKPGEVKRTLMTLAFFGRDGAALDRKLERMRSSPQARDMSASQLVAALRSHGAVAGTPDEFSEQMRGLEAAGIQEVMLQWLDQDDLEGLEGLAESVL